MSNTIQNMVRRVARMKPTERQVLVQLADDARDHLGGRSRLTTADLCQRTDLSERTIRRAYAALVDAGHITREPGPLGSATVTLVHPNLSGAKAPTKNICLKQDWPPSAAALTAGAGPSGRPPLREEDLEPITHTPRERAHEDFSGSGERQKEAAGMGQAAPQLPEPEKLAQPAPDPALDPVAAVFDAWDAMNLASGLPGGPVVRDMARRVAVDRKLREGDLPQLLAVIAKVGETVRAGGMRKRAAPGQSDIFATFDAVFEIGHAAGLRLFTRLLDGQEWGTIGPKPESAPLPPKGQAMPDDPPEIARLRQLLHDKLGGRTYANWIEGLRFEKDPAGALRVFAKTPFMVDRVRSDHGHQIGTFARMIWPSCDEVLFGLARFPATAGASD